MAKEWRAERSKLDMTVLPEHTDIEALARQQGVKPFDAADPMPTDIWSEGESTDEFIAFLRQTRHEDPLSGLGH